MKIFVLIIFILAALTAFSACRNISNDSVMPDYSVANSGAKIAQQNQGGEVRVAEFFTETDNGGGKKLEVGCRIDGHFGTACLQGGSSRCKLHECSSVSMMRESGEYTDEELEESQRIVDEFNRNGGGQD